MLLFKIQAKQRNFSSGFSVLMEQATRQEISGSRLKLYMQQAKQKKKFSASIQQAKQNKSRDKQKNPSRK